MNAILYFLLWAVIFFLMMRFGCGSHVAGHSEEDDERSGASNLRWVPPDKDIDPVCGKSISTSSAKPSVHDGMVYYFCSRDCREIFEAAPEQYVRSRQTTNVHQLETSRV